MCSFLKENFLFPKIYADKEDIIISTNLIYQHTGKILKFRTWALKRKIGLLNAGLVLNLLSITVLLPASHVVLQPDQALVWPQLNVTRFHLSSRQHLKVTSCFYRHNNLTSLINAHLLNLFPKLIVSKFVHTEANLWVSEYGHLTLYGERSPSEYLKLNCSGG